MINADTTTKLRALEQQLTEELSCQRELLECARIKRARLLENDIVTFARTVEREEGILKHAGKLRSLRESLIAQLAHWKKPGHTTITIDEVLEGLRDVLVDNIRKLRDDLREVLLELKELNDRTLPLVRQSLGLVRDLLGVVTGSQATEGYDRGGAQGQMAGKGGLMNLQA